MLIVLSPAKSLDFETPAATTLYTLPDLLPQSEKLVSKLRKMSPAKLSELMSISPQLGELNYIRYQQWHQPFTPENARQAVLAFNGEAYHGLQASTLPVATLEQAQKQLRILSGLYGVLRPLDLIQPYRLEMGTRLSYQRHHNLYDFWKTTIVQTINDAISQSEGKTLVNLASAEYFKSIDEKKLKAKVVTPEFKELKNGSYKVVSLFAKRARGAMTRFILEHKLTHADDLLAFDREGYHFNPNLSKPGNPVFSREQF